MWELEIVYSYYRYSNPAQWISYADIQNLRISVFCLVLQNEVGGRLTRTNPFYQHYLVHRRMHFSKHHTNAWNATVDPANRCSPFRYRAAMVMQRKTTKAEPPMQPWMRSLVHHQNFRSHIWILIVELRLCNVSLHGSHSRLFSLQDRHQHWLTEQQHVEFFLKKPKVIRRLRQWTFPVSCNIKIPKC